LFDYGSFLPPEKRAEPLKTQNPTIQAGFAIGSPVALPFLRRSSAQHQVTGSSLPGDKYPRPVD